MDACLLPSSLDDLLRPTRLPNHQEVDLARHHASSRLEGDFVRECEDPRPRPVHRLLPVTRSPLRHVCECPKLTDAFATDVVEGLLLTSKGHNGVLTIVDRFTKFAIYIPIHTTWSAFREAQCIMDSLIYQFHTPQRIRTDNGPAYHSLFRAFCSALGVQHTTGSPYNSQSQGGAERQHRTLLQTLRLTCDDRRNWDNYLQAAAHAYNDSEHAVTKGASANTSVCSTDHRIETFLKQHQQ
eukprot:scaffold2638_cov425-Pavlova_lutheri.AAC.1